MTDNSLIDVGNLESDREFKNLSSSNDEDSVKDETKQDLSPQKCKRGKPVHPI